MQKVKKLLLDGKQAALDYYSYYRTTQVFYYYIEILKAYEKQKYSKLVAESQNWNSYKYIQVNSHKLLFFLISEEKTELIEKIFDNNPIAKQILEDDDNPNNFFPLTFAVLNNADKISDLLIQKGANVNQIHKDGNNLVHVCSFFNKLQAMNYCIEKGVSYQQQNERGDTPLHLAAMQGHSEIIEKLLQLKCDVNIENTEHHLPIHESVLFGQYNAFQLLHKYYSGIKKGTQSPHIVHYASMLETNFILKDILENNKALANLRDSISDAVPLHFSVNSNSLECTTLLLENGALPDVKDKFGNTPLHLAVEKQNYEICRSLCTSGANIDIENEDKLTAKDLAEVAVDKKILNLFQQQSRFAKDFRQ